jgi:hypothetical protein
LLNQKGPAVIPRGLSVAVSRPVAFRSIRAPQQGVTTHRPYIQSGIAELEAITAAAGATEATRRAVLAELQHRSTARASALQERIRRQIGREAPGVQAPPPAVAAGSPRPAARPADPPAAPRQERSRPSQHHPSSEAAADGTDVLTAWTVLEVLSPVTFRRPADLAGGEARRIATFAQGLPWTGGAAKGQPGTRLFLQIVLGTLPVQPAYDQLLRAFADSRI